MNAPGMRPAMNAVVERKVMAGPGAVRTAPGATKAPAPPAPPPPAPRGPPSVRIVGPGIIRPKISITVIGVGRIVRITVSVLWSRIGVRRSNGGLRAISVWSRARRECRRGGRRARSALRGLGAHLSTSHQHRRDDLIGDTVLLESYNFVRAG